MTIHDNKVDKYAIYLRKSRADLEAEKQGESETLARHRKILTELAARKGIFVDAIYQEIVSGETIEARPEIQKLITDCYAGLYKGVLVVEISRLSRGNQGDAQIIMDCLRYANRNNGVLVVTPTKTYDVAHSIEDEEYMEFELFMSRREYKMIKKRMERGRVQSVVEGNYMGSHRPYGYNIYKTKMTRTLVENPTEGPIVRKVFDWFVNHNMTTGKIARRLENMGVPTYHGKREWPLETIRDMLMNPIYIGKVQWNSRMQVKTMVDGKLVTSRPRANIASDHYMIFDGKHQGLVDEEIYNKARKRFRVDRTKANLELKNPLATILVCAECGRVMTYHGYTKRPNTAPRIAHKSSTNCSVRSALLSDVIQAVTHGLKMCLDDFELNMNISQPVDEDLSQDQLLALRKELSRTEQKLTDLFDAWEEKLIDNMEFAKRKAINNERMEAIKHQINQLEIAVPLKQDYEQKIILFSEAIDMLLDPDVRADVKSECLKQIIDRIEFSREHDNEFILDIFLR